MASTSSRAAQPELLFVLKLLERSGAEGQHWHLPANYRIPRLLPAPNATDAQRTPPQDPSLPRPHGPVAARLAGVEHETFLMWESGMWTPTVLTRARLGRVCGVGAWDGAQITGSSGDHRHRAGPPQNPCPGRACLGGTTRHSSPDHFSHSQPHPGELRAFDHTGRRHAGIRHGVATRIRFNIVVETGVPGFIPRGR
jgi:hypothetical protein